MSFKSEIYQKDYLFWITPFIILFLIFFVIKRDNKARDEAILHYDTHRSDSTLTLKTRKAEGTGKVKITDSTFIYFAGTRANNP